MTYGLPTGTNIVYGQQQGFPEWVYELAQAFNLKASTYPGHQESERAEVGFAPNPKKQNRGIDWTGPVWDMFPTIKFCIEMLQFYNLHIRKFEDRECCGGCSVNDDGSRPIDNSEIMRPVCNGRRNGICNTVGGE